MKSKIHEHNKSNIKAVSKSYYIFFLLLFLNIGATAQTITIPDANFKAKLLSSATTNEIAKDVNDNNIKIDANNNGEIEVSEALVVYKLFYVYGGPPPFKMAAAPTLGPISDLTGIAEFANLRYLNVAANQLTVLDMSNNPLLTYLSCDGNLLTSINVSGLTNLSVLWVTNNELTEIDISDLTSLRNFNCKGNAISNLDLTPCSQLAYLDCSENQLSELNLINCQQLIDLKCYHNHIGLLTVNAPTTLKAFYCYNNQITSSIDLNNYTELINFDCDDNLITSLSFGNNPHLYRVWCANNNISTLDFSGTSLFRLSCGNNPGLTFLNVKNGIITPDRYESQFPEPPFVEDSFIMANTPALQYICHDEGEFGPELVANEGLEGISRGSYCSFTPGGNYNTISGNVTFDCGGINALISNQRMNITTNSQSGTTFTNDNGLYQFYSDGNAITVVPQFANPAYFTVTPANYTYNFVDFGNTETADFCVTANGIHPDLEVSILPLTGARPGFDAKYKVVYTNKGNQVQSGSVTLSFNDATTDFVSALPAINSQSPNSLAWDFTNLIPNERREIEVTFNLNSPTETPPINNGDILLYTVNVNSLQTDETPDDNSISYNQTVLGSWDPNDKEVVEGSHVSYLQINDYLHYVIRFQNTGTAAAENVVLRDVLSNNLDWSTLQMMSGSHPYRSTLTSGNKLEIFYQGINLPPSAVNEPASHGYIAFKIKPKSTLIVSDIIHNEANIYFDFNNPIVTNTVSTIIDPVLSVPTNETAFFKMYPNPTSGIVNITTTNNQPITKTTMNNVLGQTIMTFENNTSLDLSQLTKGTYFITVETDGGKETQRIIKQ